MAKKKRKTPSVAEQYRRQLELRSALPRGWADTRLQRRAKASAAQVAKIEEEIRSSRVPRIGVPRDKDAS